MAARIRAFDWSDTPLGPLAGWPGSLRTLTSMMLESELPIALGWGPELTCLYNDAYRPLLGNKPEALGRPFRDVWPEARNLTEPMIQQALAGKPSCFRDARINLKRHDYPERAYFDYWIGPLRDDDGQVAGLINEAVETTGRVLAERRQRFRTRLGDALRSLSDPRAVMAAAARRLGRHLRADRVSYAEMDAAGKYAEVQRDWVSGDQPSAIGRYRVSHFGEQLLAITHRGESVRLDDVAQDPRVGRELAAAFETTRLRAALTVPLVKEGRLVAVLAVQQRRPRHWTDEDEALVREVAERTWAAVERARAETALRTTSARLKLILESTTGYGILTLDLEGRITLWNPGAERLLGWREEEVLGKPAEIFFVPEERARGIPAMEMKRAAETGRAMDDRQHLRKDGSRFFASGLMMPLRNGGGRLLGYLKVLRDRTLEHEAKEALERGVAERTAELAATNRQLLAQIEERERVEATLRQMQRLEAVGQLTSGVAHDFNNLLTVISGNIGILERALDAPGADPRLRQRLGYMKDAATRGAKLTAQLLAFSRRQRLESKAVDLNSIVAGMRDLLQSSMGGSVQLSMKLQPGLWPALVDPTQIELVILNLAINARDASPVGGDLIVETANVALRQPAARPEEPPPGDYVMVAVTDHGTGMTAEVLARAFEPFFTTKEVGKGSGLGLAQVYGFAKQSGGGVRIDTRLGRGTSIKVFLPRAAATTAEAEDAPRAVAHEDKRGETRQRILLVDDDSDVREVTAAILTERGYEVIEAGSGGSALDVLDREGADVDLMLMDYAMPGMNGSEVAREAHAKQPSLPVLFITGYADFAAFKEVGDERIVAKPFSDDDLLSKVQAALGAGRETHSPRSGA